jgi:hypothetical protein
VFIYEVLFFVGAFGFLAMVLLGFAHGHGGGHSHGHGHAGAGHGHGHVGGHHTGGSAGHHDAGHAAHDSNGFSFKSILMISPLDIFSMCMGGGAAALLFKNSAAGISLPWIALIGALVFTFLLVKPLLALLFRFASKESEGLGGMVTRTGEAATKFDAQGKGLVKLIIDGETKQLLARLDESEFNSGMEIRKGDPLLVLEVDPIKNSCRVTRV